MNLRNGQLMNYGTEDSLTSKSLALWAGFLEDLAARASSQRPTESEPATGTNKTTGVRSRSGNQTFGIHETYASIRDYLEADSDRHYQKDFGLNWRTFGADTWQLWYFSSVGEFVCVNNDKHARERVFVLDAYCPNVRMANTELRSWVGTQNMAGSFNQVTDFIERAFPA